MGYLITQIIICLLIAALIGFILGWLLRGLGSKDPEAKEEKRSGFSNKPGLDTVSSSGSNGSSSQADDFYPEPVTLAPAKTRSRIEPEINKDVRQNFSDNKFSTNTLSSAPLQSSESFGSSSSSKQVDDFYPEPVTKAPAKSHKIDKIEGIGKSLGNKVRKIGIKTTRDLLKTCSTKTGFQQIIEATKVPEDIVTQWVSMADLMRIQGIDGQVAELMLASGIQSVDALTKADPQTLTEEMYTVNQRENKIPPSIELPNAGKITVMIKAAKSL